MRVSEDIITIAQFKTHASKMLRQLRQTRRPIVITQHGTPAAVVLAPEEYDRLVDREQFLAAVEAGLAEAEAGRLLDEDEVWGELETTLGPIRDTVTVETA